MKHIHARRGALIATAVGVASSLLTVAPAHAVLPTTEIAVGIAGSDTTDGIMGLIAPAFSGQRSVTISGSSKLIRTYNIPALDNTPKAVPGDTDCSDSSWQRDPSAPTAAGAIAREKQPFGSTKGRDYLGDENDGTGPGLFHAGPPQTIDAPVTGTQFGCVDVARSSGAPRTLATTPLEKSTFEYYAYAMDAVSWASTSLKAPATLTQANIVDIYNCVTTNWNQVGGTTGPIQRYLPQNGSGTRSFFASDILGNSNPASNTYPTNASCPPIIDIEENTGAGVSAANLDKAILPYSAGLWAFQESNKANPNVDVRNGSRLGGITTSVAGPPVVTSFRTPLFYDSVGRAYSLDYANATGGSGAAGVVNEANVKLNITSGSPSYPGVRYLFNVLDSVGSRQGYLGAFQLFGFNNIGSGFKSPMCDYDPASATADPLGPAAYDAILSSFVAPLDQTTNINGHNAALSTCRKFIPS